MLMMLFRANYVSNTVCFKGVLQVTCTYVELYFYVFALVLNMEVLHFYFYMKMKI